MCLYSQRGLFCCPQQEHLLTDSIILFLQCPIRNGWWEEDCCRHRHKWPREPLSLLSSWLLGLFMNYQCHKNRLWFIRIDASYIFFDDCHCHCAVTILESIFLFFITPFLLEIDANRGQIYLHKLIQDVFSDERCFSTLMVSWHHDLYGRKRRIILLYLLRFLFWLCESHTRLSKGQN